MSGLAGWWAGPGAALNEPSPEREVLVVSHDKVFRVIAVLIVMLVLAGPVMPQPMGYCPDPSIPTCNG
jgi:hypothetical protein